MQNDTVGDVDFDPTKSTFFQPIGGAAPSNVYVC